MAGGSDENPSAATAAAAAAASRDKKHAAMLDRLAHLHHTRLQESAARKSESVSAPPFESTASFLSRFSEAKRSIDSDLSHLRSLAASTTEPDAKPDLEATSAKIADLEKLVAENSYFLPSYEVRSSLTTISDLKETLEILSLELVPRKKFSFKNKSSKKDPTFLIQEAEEIRSVDVEKLDLGSIRETPGFRNRQGAVFVKQFTAAAEEFSLADLDSCEVYLKGSFRALFVHRIKNCRVFVGPVLGSVLIEDVDGCVFMLASHQIRIHQAKVTDFYLRVRSRPIIEDCNGVRFAPYLLVYEGILDELRESCLEEETDNWANVDDFRWLRAVHSPNWCILLEEERLGMIDISDMKEPCGDS